jgi:hypothetical protein
MTQALKAHAVHSHGNGLPMLNRRPSTAAGQHDLPINYDPDSRTEAFIESYVYDEELH